MTTSAHPLPSTGPAGQTAPSATPPREGGVDPGRVADLVAAELADFAASHPRSRSLFDAAKGSLVGGVPMPWMTRWPGGFPLFVDTAAGGSFTDVDGHTYVDFCLGDTGAMCGHSPAATVAAISNRAARGITTMLPTEDAAWVGEELSRRFGLARWQFTLSATDANRAAVRIARQLTGRSRILVFNGCYHGTVDETLVRLNGHGVVVPRPGSIGPPVDPALTTRVVEFNDVAALERELAHGDVAVVLAEPAMTNIGIVLPEPGYHEVMRSLTRRHGTLLALDETHTLCCGPGGATALWDLEPDIVTLGKPLGGGVPCGALGLSPPLAAALEATTRADLADVSGLGGTLAGNALSVAAMRATLGEVLTPDAYAHAEHLARRFERGVLDVIDSTGLPWHVARLGGRVEYRFHPTHPLSGAEAIASDDPELDAAMHLWALNRGVLMTPFHNMALFCRDHTEGDVDVHTELFDLAARSLT